MKIKVGQAFTAVFAVVTTIAVVIHSVHQIFQSINTIRGEFSKGEAAGQTT